MFDEKPKMVDDPNRVGKKMPVYWDTAKRLLNDPSRFLDSLLTYDKENIKESVIAKIQPYIQMEDFTTDHVAKVLHDLVSLSLSGVLRLSSSLDVHTTEWSYFLSIAACSRAMIGNGRNRTLMPQL